jgi:hypothetical protein
MSSLQLHFEGDIAVNHQVSMRTLGHSLSHLQNAFDRACIEHHNDRLWKYARLKAEYYNDCELIVEAPKEGGYILDFFTENAVTKSLINRVSAALSVAVEESKGDGIGIIENLKQSHSTKIAQINDEILKPVQLQNFIDNPGDNFIKKYGDRAIVREINQVLAIIRSVEIKITRSSLIGY